MLIAKEHGFVSLGNLLQHCPGGGKLHAGLIDIIEDDPLADFHRSFVRSAFSQAKPQQRGFANAVAADDSGALSRIERERQAAKEPALALALDDFGSRVTQLNSV